MPTTDGTSSSSTPRRRRSALDFLDAPKRLGSFLDGRFIRLLMAPAKAGGKAYMKALTAGMSLTVGVMTKLLGGELLRDAQTFVAALDTMFGGFRQRADQTYALLQNPETAFLVVAAPQRDALREAAFFVERLAVESMPLAGVVVNRVQGVEGGLTRGRAEDAAAALADEPERATTAALLRLHADLATIADAHRGHIARFTTGHPGIPLIEVPAAATDIHDLDGLRAVGAALSGRPHSAAAGVGA
jgi:anion-transporting  ArsA/GET3 family ATPase